MPSFRSSAFAIAVAFIASARADYVIDPESVPLSDRKAWCQNQLTQCPNICQEIDSRPAMVNTCDPKLLTYGCVCGDGSLPDVEKYSLTLPYFTCTEYGNQCVKACGDAAHDCARACREDNPCGAQSPDPPNSTSSVTVSTTASSTSSATSGTIFTGLAGADNSNAQNAAGTPMNPMELGRGYGAAVVLGGLFAAFAML